MPHGRLRLVLNARLLVAAERLLQAADAPDVPAAIDFGEGDLPDALAGDGEGVEVGTEEGDGSQAPDAQGDVEQLAVPGGKGGPASHERATRVVDEYRGNERVYGTTQNEWKSVMLSGLTMLDGCVDAAVQNHGGGKEPCCCPQGT